MVTPARLGLIGIGVLLATGISVGIGVVLSKPGDSNTDYPKLPSRISTTSQQALDTSLDDEDDDLPAPNPNGGFKEIAAAAGIRFRMAFLPDEQGEKFKINLYDHGCGVAVADYNGDGYDDIYFTNQLGPNALYRNKGDGTFEEVSRAAGVALGDRICVGAAWADIDNDGKPELFVTSTRGGNVLFKNLGNGKFVDITERAKVALVAHCQTAVFFDYDNDGFLDLFVTCTAKWTNRLADDQHHYYAGVDHFFDLAASPKEYNILYHNNRDGTFTDVTARAGLKGPGWGGDAAVFDFDEDGRLDILVTNMFGPSHLYRNNGDGTFSDVTRASLGRTSLGAIGSKAFDFNNDGKLDLLLVDMHSDMWAPIGVGAKARRFAKKNEKVRFATVTGPMTQFARNADDLERKLVDLFQIKYDQVILGNTLFKNVGGGKFEEMAERAGMETFWPWGIATGDFNNDGFEDVFLAAGMGFPFFYWPNRLMMNRGNETFAERSREEGIEPPPRGRYLAEDIGGKKASRGSRCAASADFRNRGCLDIVTNNFNDVPYYYQNHFPRRNYIAFRLEGRGAGKSNRDAIGALVRLYLGTEIMARQVQAAGGYLSQSSSTLHFGLGDRARIDRVEIRWPGGTRQTLANPQINRLHRILEP